MTRWYQFPLCVLFDACSYLAAVEVVFEVTAGDQNLDVLDALFDVQVRYA